ncbi:hypothetical protein [Hahella sp. HN01]|uniref:hypothetical protein n=1 Tax=Hahella sp. HN01 TaxID=2847262 RepID=UPI001C1ECE6D|nr:hypothetical protein [Hahella sp. HN01]MBU6953515.1 hypothetical protein [Hahella sp. HN01]
MFLRFFAKCTLPPVNRFFMAPVHWNQRAGGSIFKGFKLKNAHARYTNAKPKGDIVRSLLLLFICLSGCSKNIDNAMTDKDLIAEFSGHEQSFKLLIDMITADASSLQKFEIGNDRVGEYRLYDEGWEKQYGNYVPLEVVLAEYSLTKARHQEYLKLLSNTNASKIERYNGSVSVVISTSGFLFGGCISLIRYDPKKLELTKPSWAQVYYQAKFNDNWGGETKCN